jgi:galactokinase
MRGADLLSLDPVPALLARVRGELSADFLPNRSTRISRAPGRLDVMGGIADYTGSLVCEATLDRAAAVALQQRDDRNVQIFSFNLFDENRPFTFRIPLDALAGHSIDTLRSEFNQPGRRWAGYLAGCLAILHHHERIDLADPSLRGMNLALLSTVPLGSGVSSSAAIEVAAMINFMDELNIRGS